MKPNKNMLRIYIALAIVLVVFCVVAVALPFVKNAVFWISLVMTVIAIGVQIYVMQTAFAKGEGVKSKFYGWPIARIGVMYLAAQIILSLVFMALALWIPAWVVIVLDVILLGVSAIGFIAADATRDEIERQDVQLKKNVTVMRGLQSKVSPMAFRCEDAAAAKAVTELAEQLRYSDPVSSDALAEIEAQLSAAIDALQTAVDSADAESICQQCAKASALLAERNRLCKLNK